MLVKKIHQTWKDKDIPHEIYSKFWVDSWRRMTGGWDYKLWTDSDNDTLVKDHYPQFYKDYRKIDRGVVRSDIARVLILHRHGGIYADLDFVCLKPFGRILSPFSDLMVFGTHKQDQAPIPNAWMYSPPGVPFWLKMIEDAFKDWKAGQRQPEKIAGPDRLHWALMAYKPEHVRLPYEYVYPHAWGCPHSEKRCNSSDWSSLEGLRRSYPDSYAITGWAHNW